MGLPLPVTMNTSRPHLSFCYLHAPFTITNLASLYLHYTPCLHITPFSQSENTLQLHFLQKKLDHGLFIHRCNFAMLCC